MNLDLPNFASIKGGMKLVRSAKVFYEYSTVIKEGYIPPKKKERYQSNFLTSDLYIAILIIRRMQFASNMLLF